MIKSVIVDNRIIFDENIMHIIEQIRYLNILKKEKVINHEFYKKTRLQIEESYNRNDNK